MRLKGKAAIVTGGASGIGRATAIRFAEEGAKVAVSDIDEAGGEETVRLIREKGGEAIFVQTDVADSKQVSRLVQTAVDAFGGLHILFNNAGIGHSEVRSTDLSEEEWDRVINVNLKGVFLGIKYAVPALKASGVGRLSTRPACSG
ncbi:Glucose 1-dehydrogenase 2 [Geobacillus sp. BCO2]|nr:Glucose 1-dehydrogenase 2 [Geobacillus sp. BCO2]